MSFSAGLRPGGGLRFRPRGDAGHGRRRFLVGAGIALAAIVVVWLAVLLLGGFGVVNVAGTPLHAAYPFGVPHLTAHPPTKPARRLSSSVPSRAAAHRHRAAAHHHGAAATAARHHARAAAHHRSGVHRVVTHRGVVRRWTIPAKRVRHGVTHRPVVTPNQGGSVGPRHSEPKQPAVSGHYQGVTKVSGSPTPAGPSPSPAPSPTTSSPAPTPTTPTPSPSPAPSPQPTTPRATGTASHSRSPSLGHYRHHSYGSYGGYASPGPSPYLGHRSSHRSSFGWHHR